MAQIAEGDDESAKPVLTTLQKHPRRDIKRAAQQMLFQNEAQDFLKTSQQGPANAEFSKLARAGLGRSLGVAADKRYDTAAAYLTNEKRPPVTAPSEARLVLRSAAVTRATATPQRIAQALQLLGTLPRSQTLPPEPARAGALCGEWLLGFTSSGGALS